MSRVTGIVMATLNTSRNVSLAQEKAATVRHSNQLCVRRQSPGIQSTVPYRCPVALLWGMDEREHQIELHSKRNEVN